MTIQNGKIELIFGVPSTMWNTKLED